MQHTTHSRPRSISGIPESIWLDNISSVLDFDLKSILSGSLYNDLTLASYLYVVSSYIHVQYLWEQLHNYNYLLPYLRGGGGQITPSPLNAALDVQKVPNWYPIHVQLLFLLLYNDHGSSYTRVRTNQSLTKHVSRNNIVWLFLYSSKIVMLTHVDSCSEVSSVCGNLFSISFSMYCSMWVSSSRCLVSAEKVLASLAKTSSSALQSNNLNIFQQP